MKMNKNKLKKLQSLLCGKGDEVPEGYYTISELCKMFNKTRNPMCVRVKRLMEQSPETIDRKFFFVHADDGRLHKIPHYKFKGI